MSPEVQAALIAFVAALIGGSVQYFGGRSSDRKRQYAELRTDAYRQFFQATTGFGKEGARTDLGFNPREMLLEAKAKVSLYGSRKVINKMAIFFRDHAALMSLEANEAFVDIAEAMRRDSFGENYIGFRDDFRWLLLEGAR